MQELAAGHARGEFDLVVKNVMEVVIGEVQGLRGLCLQRRVRESQHGD